MTKILNKYGKNNVQQGQKTKKGNKKFNNFKTYFLIFILIVITKKKQEILYNTGEYPAKMEET